jgi:hypothetical protein
LFEPEEKYSAYLFRRGTAVAQWLRYCAPNQKVVGSITVGVVEFFLYINPLIAL